MRALEALLVSIGLCVPLALAPKADAQIAITIGGPPPICSYGYYSYSPYACAPVGYYGPGYFYNGIFLGLGPWAGWGYNHGWGSHRFNGAGGGRYTGGFAQNRGRAASPSVVRANGNRNTAHKVAANNSHAAPAHSSSPKSAPHAAPARSGSESHGDGGGHR